MPFFPTLRFAPHWAELMRPFRAFTTVSKQINTSTPQHLNNQTTQHLNNSTTQQSNTSTTQQTTKQFNTCDRLINADKSTRSNYPPSSDAKGSCFWIFTSTGTLRLPSARSRPEARCPRRNTAYRKDYSCSHVNRRSEVYS